MSVLNLRKLQEGLKPQLTYREEMRLRQSARDRENFNRAAFGALIRGTARRQARARKKRGAA